MGTLLDKPVTEKHTASFEQDGLKFAASSMQGWRVEMEDQHTITLSIPELTDHALVAVFDGHGGMHAAQYAASNILATLVECDEFKQYCKSKQIGLLENAMTSCFMHLDVKLRQSSEVSSGDRSGCTALAAVITPTHITVASSGDSRVVLGTGSTVVAMSQDHKPDNPLEKRRIERAGGCVSMKRVDGDLAVSRALGDFQYKERSDLKESEQKVSPEPEVRSHVRMRADLVLILACDGIWDVMNNNDALEVFKQCAAEGESNLGLCCEELLDQCLFKGSRDNMSVVAVAFPGLQINEGGGGVLARRAAREQEETRKQEERNQSNLPQPSYNAGFQQARNGGH